MRRRSSRQPDAPASLRPRLPLGILFDIIVVVVALACFWPLVRFFFAQDDFVFLERAAGGFGEAVGGFFSARPGHFRPLTKGVYFLTTWPIFGLNATPYHVISIVLHGINAVLTGIFLRRIGIGEGVSRFVTVLFAVTVAYLEVVAWVACIQQLLGFCFMLLTLIFGMDAMRTGTSRSRILAAVALTGAYASYEQTLAAPVVLVGAFALRNGVRATISALRRVWVLGAILVAYMIFVLGVRGVPDEGPYVMSLGPHVLANLREYVGLAYAVWVVLPAYGLPSGFTVSHGVLLGLTAWLAVRRRLAGLAFGLGSFLVLLAPVLFVKDHTHSFHLYVPAIGTWFLLAAVLDDALAPLRQRDARAATSLLVVASILFAVVSAVFVRENVRAVVSPGLQLPRSFVLRRAVIAERMRDAILQKSRLRGRAGRLVMIYTYPEYRANWLNVHAALGQGSAVRLILESPDLDVLWSPPSELPPSNDPNIEVLVYTELGRVYTAAEVVEAQRQRREAGGGAPADTTVVVPPDD